MKTVADTVNENWGFVFKMNIMEFLNILCFVHDRNDEEKRQREEYLRKNKV